MVMAAADGPAGPRAAARLIPGPAKGRPQIWADHREDDFERVKTLKNPLPASGVSSVPCSPISRHGGKRCGSAVGGACPPRVDTGASGATGGQPFTPRLKRSNSSGDVLILTPMLGTSSSCSRLISPRDEQRLREVGQKELHLRAARERRLQQREAQKLQEERQKYERQLQESALKEEKEKLQEEERVRRFLEVERRRELAEAKRREREQQAKTLPSPCRGHSPRGQQPHGKDNSPVSARGTRPNLFVDEKHMISKHERERQIQEAKEARQRERAECLRQQREVSAGYQAQAERAHEEREQKKIHEQLKQARAREQRQAAAESRAQEKRLQAQLEQSREFQKLQEQGRIALFKQQENEEAARRKLREQGERELKMRERRHFAAEGGEIRQKLQAQARAAAELEKQQKREAQDRRRQEEKLRRAVEIQEKKEMNHAEKDKLWKKKEEERLTFFFQPPSPRARLPSHGAFSEQDYDGSWLNTPRVRAAVGGQ